MTAPPNSPGSTGHEPTDRQRADREAAPRPSLDAGPSDSPGAEVTAWRPTAIRGDFPILESKVHGLDLVYLDNAATSQKPLAVIEAVDRYYREQNSNIHRGVHALSELATREYEGARAKVGRFLNAADPREVVFVRGGTEAINLVAETFGRGRIGEGDEIVLTRMEHHANIVPWQMLAERSGAKIRVVSFDDRGVLDTDELASFLGERTKMLALTHVSNALGTVNPVRDICRLAKAKGIPVLLDGAQAIPHTRIDVQDLGCDFYAFSGHKMFAPTGIGVLWGRLEHLEAMPPYQGGGEMIRSVSFEEGTSFNDVPHKFEAGTPNIAGTVGLGAAIDYLESIGMDRIAAWEHDLLEYATGLMRDIPGVRLYGTAPEKAGVLSFLIEGVHPHDAGTILDREGVAVRAGHHCAQPVMDRFGIPAMVRASLAFHNDRSDIDRLAKAVRNVQEIFG